MVPDPYPMLHDVLRCVPVWPLQVAHLLALDCACACAWLEAWIAWCSLEMTPPPGGPAFLASPGAGVLLLGPGPPAVPRCCCCCPPLLSMLAVSPARPHRRSDGWRALRRRPCEGHALVSCCFYCSWAAAMAFLCLLLRSRGHKVSLPVGGLRRMMFVKAWWRAGIGQRLEVVDTEETAVA